MNVMWQWHWPWESVLILKAYCWIIVPRIVTHHFDNKWLLKALWTTIFLYKVIRPWNVSTTKCTYRNKSLHTQWSPLSDHIANTVTLYECWCSKLKHENTWNLVIWQGATQFSNYVGNYAFALGSLDHFHIAPEVKWVNKKKMLAR